ncbi:hypothetical protein LZ32DRAFT_661578 [Colletotrichum eremochloae]|nr:hypothetical protein LZ32DRAFT_661578 [Colletotrichum eremochloae]
MLISESFAAFHGMCIDRSVIYCEGVEFADGSRSTTSGIARGVNWTFRSMKKSVFCDFYVPGGLSVDVVLSGDFLFKPHVFSRYEHCMVQHDFVGDVANMHNINLIRKLLQELEIAEDFLKKGEEDGLRFRDGMRGHLESVPHEDDLLTARRLESRRLKDWEEHQEQFGQRLRSQTSSDGASSEGPFPAATQRKKARRPMGYTAGMVRHEKESGA